MATLPVDTTEMPRDKHGRAIPAMRPIESGAMKIAIGSSSVQNGTAWNAYTKIISIYTDVDCYIEIGDNPTATTNSHFIPANMYMYLSIMVGRNQNAKIAVIRSSSDGTLYISQFQ